MRRVVQKTDSDCGVAAVAMLAGVSYAEAKIALFGLPSRKSRNTYATRRREVMVALFKLGIRTEKRFTYRRRVGLPALVHVMTKDGAHWIVEDADGRHLDPSEPRHEWFEVVHYLHILGRAGDA